MGRGCSLTARVVDLEAGELDLSLGNDTQYPVNLGKSRNLPVPNKIACVLV